MGSRSSQPRRGTCSLVRQPDRRGHQSTSRHALRIARGTKSTCRNRDRTTRGYFGLRLHVLLHRGVAKVPRHGALIEGHRTGRLTSCALPSERFSHTQLLNERIYFRMSIKAFLF
ncbi:hypothetical protein GN956_G15365 [Arapaima gigas]